MASLLVTVSMYLFDQFDSEIKNGLGPIYAILFLLSLVPWEETMHGATIPAQYWLVWWQWWEHVQTVTYVIILSALCSTVLHCSWPDTTHYQYCTNLLPWYSVLTTLTLLVRLRELSSLGIATTPRESWCWAPWDGQHIAWWIQVLLRSAQSLGWEGNFFPIFFCFIQELGGATVHLVENLPRQLDGTTMTKSSALGLFGIPGLTAYIGLMEIGKPKVGNLQDICLLVGWVSVI